MTTKKDNLKILYDRRERLRLEIEAHRARLDEVESMIKLLSGEVTAEVDPPHVERKTRRGDLKGLVLELYEKAGEAGLSSQDCITVARARGIELQPASVSSLLSRLKADDVLFYDGSRYRLKRFAGPRNPASREVV